jgi:hypothetical protein
VDRASATPFEVSAGHDCRSPGFDEQETVTALAAGGCGSSADAGPGVATSAKPSIAAARGTTGEGLASIGQWMFTRLRKRRPLRFAPS